MIKEVKNISEAILLNLIRDINKVADLNSEFALGWILFNEHLVTMKKILDVFINLRCYY